MRFSDSQANRGNKLQALIRKTQLAVYKSVLEKLILNSILVFEFITTTRVIAEVNSIGDELNTLSAMCSMKSSLVLKYALCFLLSDRVFSHFQKSFDSNPEIPFERLKSFQFISIYYH